MPPTKRALLASVVVGIAVGLFVVFAALGPPPSGVTISSVELSPSGPSGQYVGLYMLSIVPTGSIRTLPPSGAMFPLEVSPHQNVSLVWSVWISSSATHRLNVSEVDVAAPFTLTSLSYGWDWSNLPNDTELEEAVTVLAPATPGTYSIGITVSFVPVLS